MADPVVVLLGNSAPQVQRPVTNTAGEVVGSQAVAAEHMQQSVTRVEMQPDFADEEFVKQTLSTDNDRHLMNIARALAGNTRYAVGIQHLEQIMDIHAGGAKPDWVTCDDKDFEAAISAYYGIRIGEPTALLTNGGRDALHAQHMSTSAQPASFNYIALTASTTAPAPTDTTLTGEITTAGGGLLRAQATYAHTTGTNTTTLTKTFTANGSDVLPVTIAQIGVFNASTSGTLGYHTALSSTATLNVSGDNVTITETVTGG
jgi:hypothetical protein